MSVYSNEQLILEALDDSDLTFGRLFEQYQQGVLRAIASIVSDEEVAQDVAQEAFLAAWSSLSKLRDKQKFGRWLNQIAINLSKLWLRDQRKYREGMVPLDEVAMDLTNEPGYHSDKLRQEVWEAIDELVEDQREAVILYYIGGYSYKEMSEMLSVPVSTIQGRLQKARNTLRKEFLDMVSKLQLEIDSTVYRFLKELAKQDGLSIEGLIIRLIKRYKQNIDSPEISVRKIPGEWFGRPSPDGQYLSMIDWETGNLTVRDLTTGEIRNVTNDGQPPKHRCIGYSTWSPDNKQIAYLWLNDDHKELRITSLNGSKQRVLNDDMWPCDWSECSPSDWSQDGRFLLAELLKPDGVSEIVLVSVADGSLRTLKSFGGQWPRVDKMSLSTDGRYVVYSRPRKEPDDVRDIFLLATDGSGEEIRVAGHPDGLSVAPFMAWDGKTIVFTSFTQGDSVNDTSMWLAQTIDGKPVGEPKLVMRSTGYISIKGFTEQGSLYYSIAHNHSVVAKADIYIASLDMETGETLEPPALLRSDGSNMGPAWSPDGKSLAYLSLRHSPEGTGSRTALVVRSMKTGEERETFQGIKERFGNPYLQWSPDGRFILCGDLPNLGLSLMDLQTGDFTIVMARHPRIGIWGPTWSRDGKTVFYIRVHTKKGKLPDIVAYNVATGQEKELCPGGSAWTRLIVSPDGEQLFFSDRDGKALKVISTSGGETREILSVEGRPGGIKEWIFPLVWTPDERHLLFGKHRHSAGDCKTANDELWRISAEGGKPEKLWEIKEPPGGLKWWGTSFHDAGGLWKVSFHPDGKHIAYAEGSDSGQHEFWVMDNLLKTLAADN